MVRIDSKKEGRKTVYFRSDIPDLLMDSKGEVYISLWLDQLIKAGYVKEWNAQPEPFILTEKVTREIEKQLKTKTKLVESSVLTNMSYTADFKIVWTQKAFDDNLVIEYSSKIKKEPHHLFAFSGTSYLEAKPDNLSCKTFDQNGMTKSVRAKIKQVYDKHNIIVELVFTNKLFRDTFLPDRYILNDKLATKRAIKYTTKSLLEFIKEIKPKVNTKLDLKLKL